MKKIAVALLLAITLLCMPALALATTLGVSPSSAELEVPKDGFVIQEFTFTGYTGTVVVGLENIPLTIDPIGSIEVTDGETVEVTFYSDGTNNTYEGHITFLALGEEQVLVGIRVGLTVHVNMTTEVVEPAPSGGGGGGGDTTSPKISDISASNIGETNADIYWETNESSTSQVEYWSSPKTLTPLDKTYTREHLVHLTNLEPGTTYYYRTISRDRSGNRKTSDEQTFTTLEEEVAEVEPEEVEPLVIIIEEPEPEPEPVIAPAPEPPVELEPAPEPSSEWLLTGGIAGGIVGLLVVLGLIGYWIYRKRKE